jgi:hypothetical protein
MGFANKLDILGFERLNERLHTGETMARNSRMTLLGLGVRLSQCRHLRVKLGGKLKPEINLPKGERPFWHS